MQPCYDHKKIACLYARYKQAGLGALYEVREHVIEMALLKWYSGSDGAGLQNSR